MNIVDEIIAERQRKEREAVEARIASSAATGRLVDPTTCPHHFFTDRLGMCSNCGTYVGLSRGVKVSF